MATFSLAGKIFGSYLLGLVLQYLEMSASASSSDRNVSLREFQRNLETIEAMGREKSCTDLETSEKCSGTFCSAHGLQQNIVFANLFFVMLKFSPKLIQLFIGELPRALGLKET